MMRKEEVRKQAEEKELPARHRKDSQGICFLGKISYTEFLKHYLGTKPGPIINADTKEEIGTHEGYWLYTIGQRRGISTGLQRGPWYVVDKDHTTNTVYVSNEYQDKKQNACVVEDIRWIAQKPDLTTTQLKVKMRHGPQLYTCTVREQEDGSMYVSIDGSDQGIAPGQFAVFYDNTYCLGSGIIREGILDK